MPPYDPTRFPTIDFGWGQKIAPRLGGAYDLFHNGKVKIYGGYGVFYDIMKMGLARGSFGSDYCTIASTPWMMRITQILLPPRTSAAVAR